MSFFAFDTITQASVFNIPADFWHAFLLFLATYFGNKQATNGK